MNTPKEKLNNTRNFTVIGGYTDSKGNKVRKVFAPGEPLPKEVLDGLVEPAYVPPLKKEGVTPNQLQTDRTFVDNSKRN